MQISHLVLVGLLGAATNVAGAAQSTPVNLRIDALPLERALSSWAEQTGYQLLVSDSPSTRAHPAPPLDGLFSPEDALRVLLQGTNLRYEFVNRRTVAIRTADASPTSSSSHARPERQSTGEDASQSGHSSASTPGLQEVVVTAQKRDQRVQDVPIAIAVLGGQDLDRSNAQSVNDMLSLVPGVVASSRGGAAASGSTLLAVRGVNAPASFNVGSSPIGYYLDSMPVGFVRMALVPSPDVYDLSRVEVLRGPQGTLYGAGSQNGVVRVITNDANLEKFEFKARGSRSLTQDGGGNWRGDMAVNVPIIDDKLGARVVVGYQDLSGWIDKPNRRDANDTVLKNARIKINARPTDALSIGVSAWSMRSDYGAPSNGNGGYVSPVTQPESGSQDFDTYGVNISYDFSNVQITSSTSYLKYAYTDSTVSTPGAAAILYTHLPAKTFSEELYLSSHDEGEWRWTAGGMYRDGQDRLYQSFTGFNLPQSVKFISRSWAAFGELTRKFFDGRWEVTAGVRHFEDTVPMHEESRLGNAPPATLISTEKKFQTTTPRYTVVWHPMADLMAYASYSEGFRSGFDQLPSVLAGVPTLPDVKPDLLKNYEIGTKGSLLDGALTYDAAAFYINWHDVQLPLGVLVNGIVRSAALNGPSASGPGVDLALATHPMQGLTFSVNFGWNDLTVDSDVLAGNVLVFKKGERMSLSPKMTVAGAVDYIFGLGKLGLNGRLNLSAGTRSRLTAVTFGNTSRIVVSGNPVSNNRFSFSVDSTGGWSTSVFVDNFNNQDPVVAPNSSPFLPSRERPRTFGLQLEYRF